MSRTNWRVVNFQQKINGSVPTFSFHGYNSHMTLSTLNFVYLFVGLLAGIIINTLADYLPSSSTPLMPQWHTWGWSKRKRPLLVFICTALLFFLLPFWLTITVNLIFNSIYIAILILVIVTDLEHKLIYNLVTFPGTLLALIGSFFVTPNASYTAPLENSIYLSLVGAVVGFVLFWVLYKLANLIYGEDRIPLGMGDVKLAMMMGAMLGFHRIFFALFWGIILGGVITVVLLLTRRVSRNSALPYGQYLAISGIAFLIWGAEYAQQYLN